MTTGSWLFGRRQHLWFWAFLAFLCAITHSFRVRGRFQWPLTPGTRLLRIHQSTSFRVLLAIFVGHNTLFCDPGKISSACHIRYTIIGVSSKLAVSSISGHFVGYNTRFWCPGTISITRDPRYTAIWTSSTLVVSGISSLFCALEHTVFVSMDD